MGCILVAHFRRLGRTGRMYSSSDSAWRRVIKSQLTLWPSIMNSPSSYHILTNSPVLGSWILISVSCALDNAYSYMYGNNPQILAACLSTTLAPFVSSLISLARSNPCVFISCSFSPHCFFYLSSASSLTSHTLVSASSLREELPEVPNSILAINLPPSEYD